MIEILNKIIEPSKKTQILYGVSINHTQLLNYLQMLLKLKMIEEIEEPFKGYRIADNGKLFLQLVGGHVK
jgi:predicted transcriptional regulator